MRRIERELIDEYRSIIEKELISLTPERYDTARELAELPDAIRGYEDVKLENVERFRQAVRQKLRYRHREGLNAKSSRQSAKKSILWISPSVSR